MKRVVYNSTRGQETNIEASEAIVKGLAQDGGLFVPSFIPNIKLDFEALSKKTYQEVACYVLGLFLTDFTEDEINYCVYSAYDEKFDTPEIAPIVKCEDHFYLELFHGATIAFKDMALSILPYLMTTAAKKLGITKEIVILTATSGDTGKAALAGFSDVEGTKILVFYPKEGVSKIQERQMVTSEGENTLVVGMSGNFDDAQTGVKHIFHDNNFNKELEEGGYILSSANSINIGRLLPQVVYYVYAYVQMIKNQEIQVGEPINVVVPTGNFGNILAAYYAKKLGVPYHQLICASNDNKVLFDFFETGCYDRRRDFILTISPSMDILISSNLERLIYEVAGESPEMVQNFMDMLAKDGMYTITADMKNELRDFKAEYALEEETLKAIKAEYIRTNYVLDPHTAVAKVAYDKHKAKTKAKDKDNYKTIIVSTASPYKFTESTLVAIDSVYTGIDDFLLLKELNKVSNVAIPAAVKNLEHQKILHTAYCTQETMKDIIRGFLAKR